MNVHARRMPEPSSPPAHDRRTRLIVNADDFGFYLPVSDGILDACRAGRVTATGVFANGPALESRLEALLSLPGVTPGVHLNLTLGVPLTGELRHRFRDNRGRFPSKLALLARLASGRLPLRALADEWRAQIRRVVRLGVRPWFLNSHEHVHAWPALARMMDELAGEFSVPWVRHVTPEWRLPLARGALARNVAIGLLGSNCTGSPARHPPHALLGMAVSGRLHARYFDRRLADVPLDTTCELMCHPGHEWPTAPLHLRAYHAWEQELDFLLGPEFARLLVTHDVRLVSYADIDRERTP